MIYNATPTISLAILCAAFSFSSLEGISFIYRDPLGKLGTIEVPDHTPIDQTLSLIQNQIICENNDSVSYAHPECFVDFMDAQHFEAVFVAKGKIRNYTTPMTDYEKKKIRYVIETMGYSSLFAIAKASSELESAGKEVDHVHPLRFLAFIFSDEKLKAAIHNIKDSSWTWNKFSKGLREGLEEEFNQHNLLTHLDHFSTHLKINTKKIHALAEQKKWKEFIDLLFNDIPRSKDANRYNM